MKAINFKNEHSKMIISFKNLRILELSESRKLSSVSIEDLVSGKSL